MRAGLFPWLAALAVVPGTCKLALHESDSPAVLRLGVHRNRVHDPVHSDRRRFKRDQTLEVDIAGYGMSGELYSTNLTVGSPPQHIEVSVDTGSSDLWVVADNNPVCREYGARCNSLGTYDPSASDSFHNLGEDFTITYGDQSSADGYYATDQLEIEGATIPRIQFGVATQSSLDKGILGLGYVNNVAAKQVYTNFPELLVQNKIINSNAYSLWLNRLGEDEGNVLFGGVNTAHFTGELQTLPIIPMNNAYYHLWITLTGLGVVSQDDHVSKSYPTADFPIVVLLDSGASISYLPAELVAQIYNDLDVYLYNEGQFGYVPCDSYLVGREDYNVTFTFSDLTISVPLRELVLDDAIYYSDDTLDIDGEKGCIFGIAPSAAFFPILGDSFLRSAYVVFDLDNNEISLAQANFNPGPDHILEITTGPNAVPDATLVPDPVTTATVELSGAYLTFPAGFTNTPIFPSRKPEVLSSSSSATTTTSADAQETLDPSHDPFVPTFGGPGVPGLASSTATAEVASTTGAGTGTGTGTGTGAATTPTGGAARPTGHTLVAGVLVGGLFLFM